MRPFQYDICAFVADFCQESFSFTESLALYTLAVNDWLITIDADKNTLFTDCTCIFIVLSDKKRLNVVSLMVFDYKTF